MYIKLESKNKSNLGPFKNYLTLGDGEGWSGLHWATAKGCVTAQFLFSVSVLYAFIRCTLCFGFSMALTVKTTSNYTNLLNTWLSPYYLLENTDWRQNGKLSHRTNLHLPFIMTRLATDIAISDKLLTEGKQTHCFKSKLDYSIRLIPLSFKPTYGCLCVIILQNACNFAFINT